MVEVRSMWTVWTVWTCVDHAATPEDRNLNIAATLGASAVNH